MEVAKRADSPRVLCVHLHWHDINIGYQSRAGTSPQEIQHFIRVQSRNKYIKILANTCPNGKLITS